MRAFPAVLGIIVVVLLTAARGAHAQEDAMEAQRCVWRCLADSPGAASAAYNACVAAQCGFDDTPPAETAVWTGGTTSDGQGRYAGVADSLAGSEFYFMCAPGGRAVLALVGPEGPAVTLTVTVDSQAFAVPFQGDGIEAYAQIPPDAPVMTALLRGREAKVLNSAGYVLGTFPLSGANAAIQTAWSGCQ